MKMSKIHGYKVYLFGLGFLVFKPYFGNTTNTNGLKK